MKINQARPTTKSHSSLWFTRTVWLMLMTGLIFSPTVADQRKKTSTVVSPVQEVAWGEKALRLFLKDRPLSSDGILALRVDEIGRQVSRVSDRPNLVFRYMVVEGEELQAFSFPGGTVCITENLARLFPSDDEIAFILGHELSHLVLRHHVSLLRFEVAMKSGVSGEEALLETVRSLMDQEIEMEADRFGALYAVRSGYKFTATYEALERLSKATAGPQEDDSHPDFGLRSSALRDFRTELERSLEAFESGLAALLAGEADDAISKLKYFVAEFPNSVSGRVNLGASYLARIRKKSGIPSGLSEVLPILPDAGITLRNYIDVVDLNQARENFEQALEIRPDEPMAEAGLALVEMRLADYDKARKHLEKARATSPDRPELVLCQGKVEFLAEDFPAAASLYIESLKLQPDWPEAEKNLALTYEKLGKLDQALNLWSDLREHEDFGIEAHRHHEKLTRELDGSPIDPQEGGNMDCKIKDAGLVQVLQCRGDIKITGGDRDYREAIERLVNEGHRKIVVTLKHVGFLDSAGIGELISTRKKLQELGGDIRLAELSKRVNDILSRFPQNFDIYLTEVQAVDSFR